MPLATHPQLAADNPHSLQHERWQWHSRIGTWQFVQQVMMRDERRLPAAPASCPWPPPRWALRGRDRRSVMADSERGVRAAAREAMSSNARRDFEQPGQAADFLPSFFCLCRPPSVGVSRFAGGLAKYSVDPLRNGLSHPDGGCDRPSSPLDLSRNALFCSPPRTTVRAPKDFKEHALQAEQTRLAFDGARYQAACTSHDFREDPRQRRGRHSSLAPRQVLALHRVRCGA